MNKAQMLKLRNGLRRGDVALVRTSDVAWLVETCLTLEALANEYRVGTELRADKRITLSAVNAKAKTFAAKALALFSEGK